MEAIGSFFKIEKDPFYIKGQQTATQREQAKAEADKCEMALKLRIKGMSVEEIAELTKLSVEEIYAL